MEIEQNDQSLKLFIVLSRAYRAVNEHVNKTNSKLWIKSNGICCIRIVVS